MRAGWALMRIRTLRHTARCAMKLTPLDIRKQEFSRKFRGCDPEEVQAFLNMAATQWEELGDERQGLENRVAELRAKLEHYEKVEAALEEALRITRESSEKTIRNAEAKARDLVEKAEFEARKYEEDARRTVHEIRRQASRLEEHRLELTARLRALLASETELLARYEEHANLLLGKLHAAGEEGPGEPRSADPAPVKATKSRKKKETAQAPPEPEETEPPADASVEAEPDAPRARPAPRKAKPKSQENAADAPDSPSDIQHIRRVLSDLD